MPEYGFHPDNLNQIRNWLDRRCITYQVIPDSGNSEMSIQFDRPQDELASAELARVILEFRTNYDLI